MLLSLLLLAPASLFPSHPALRDAAERSAPTLARLGPFLEASTVTRWGVLFALGGCPYSSPGSTGCSSAPNGCPNCKSPQQPTECVIWCGSNGVAPYGGAPCKYVSGGKPCQTCPGSGPVQNQMYCSRKAHTDNTTHSDEKREGDRRQTTRPCPRRLVVSLVSCLVSVCCHCFFSFSSSWL